MTGERLGWFRIASHLGAPVDELRDRMTYTEFVDWITFLALEQERDEKQDYYLAQIAAEVRRSFVADPKTVKVKDFLMTQKSAKVDAAKEVKPKSKSKSAWAAALKLKIGDN